MRARLRCGGQFAGGGVKGYPLDQIYEEVAFLGYYMHWDYDKVLNMEHAERRRWCEEAGKINKKIGGEQKSDFFDA